MLKTQRVFKAIVENLLSFQHKFGRKRSSIYNYRKKLRESNGNLEVLNDKSKVPIHKRSSDISPKIIEFIKDIRKEIADIGEKKIKIFFDKYCQENNLKTISESTIGRIIKRIIFFL